MQIKSWTSRFLFVEPTVKLTILKTNSTMKCNEMKWNAMKSNEMQWNAMKCNEMQWNVLKQVVVKLNIFKRNFICFNSFDKPGEKWFTFKTGFQR